MTAYKDGDRWRYHTRVKLPNGRHVRLKGSSPAALNTKAAALAAEREHIERAIHDAVVEKHAPGALTRALAPTLAEWWRGGVTSATEEYRGRFWTEFVVGEKDNRGSTKHEKRKVFERYLEASLGSKRLDEINLSVVNTLRAELKARQSYKGKPLSPKTIANVLGVLATSLRYAEATEVIERMPPIRIRAVPPPPIECWTFDEYGRIVGAAQREGEPWETAVLLAGEAGLRVGEVLGLEWPDLDLVANTITVMRQVRQGKLGPPKGGKARTIPMTPRLGAHLRGVPRIHTGRVVAIAGEPVGEGQASHMLRRIGRIAGLREHQWHTLRHTFATHLALLSVNPMRLQAWLGHSTLNMTLRYVHFAEAHEWPIPDDVLKAAVDVLHPDRRVIAQLGARPIIWPKAGPTPPPARRHRRNPVENSWALQGLNLRLIPCEGITLPLS